MERLAQRAKEVSSEPMQKHATKCFALLLEILTESGRRRSKGFFKQAKENLSKDKATNKQLDDLKERLKILTKRETLLGINVLLIQTAEMSKDTKVIKRETQAISKGQLTVMLGQQEMSHQVSQIRHDGDRFRHTTEIADRLDPDGLTVIAQSRKDRLAIEMSRFEGIGNWILAEQYFLDWRNLSLSSLWLCGDSGCGKSSVATKILSALLKDSKKFVSYFYFQPGKPETTTVAQALRTMSALLAKRSEEYAKYVQHQCETERSWESLQDAWDTLFMGYLQDHPEAVFILVLD